MSYSRINWKNESQGATPLNAENLNKMDEAIADLDERMTDAERGLRVASPTQLGIVRPDGVTVKTSASGVLTAVNGGGGGASVATQVSYDDSITQLDADNVQNALEKVADKTKAISGIETAISDIEDTIEKADNNGFISRNIFNVLDYTIFQSSSQSKWNASNNGIRLTSNYFSTYGKYLLKLNPNDTYTFSYKVLVNDGAVYTEINDIDTSTNIFRKNDALNHEVIISGVTNIEIVITGGASPTNALIYDIQLEKGSSASAYTPYALSNVELTETLNEIDEWVDVSYTTNSQNYIPQSLFKVRRNRNFLRLMFDVKAVTPTSGWTYGVVTFNNPNFEIINEYRGIVNVHWDETEASSSKKLGINVGVSGGIALLNGVSGKRYYQDILIPIKLR